MVKIRKSRKRKTKKSKRRNRRIIGGKKPCDTLIGLPAIGGSCWIDTVLTSIFISSRGAKLFSDKLKKFPKYDNRYISVIIDLLKDMSLYIPNLDKNVNLSEFNKNQQLRCEITKTALNAFQIDQLPKKHFPKNIGLAKIAEMWYEREKMLGFPPGGSALYTAIFFFSLLEISSKSLNDPPLCFKCEEIECEHDVDILLLDSPDLNLSSELTYNRKKYTPEFIFVQFRLDNIFHVVSLIKCADSSDPKWYLYDDKVINGMIKIEDDIDVETTLSTKYKYSEIVYRYFYFKEYPIFSYD